MLQLSGLKYRVSVFSLGLSRYSPVSPCLSSRSVTVASRFRPVAVFPVYFPCCLPSVSRQVCALAAVCVSHQVPASTVCVLRLCRPPLPSTVSGRFLTQSGSFVTLCSCPGHCPSSFCPGLVGLQLCQVGPSVSVFVCVRCVRGCVRCVRQCVRLSVRCVRCVLHGCVPRARGCFRCQFVCPWVCPLCPFVCARRL